MKKTSTLFEDTTMAYNRWVQGIASRELSTTKVTLKDIADDKQVKPLGSNPKKDIPIHPTLSKTPDIVGSMLTDLSNLELKLKAALMSNLAEDRKKKQILQELLLLTKHNRRITNRIINAFTKIT